MPLSLSFKLESLPVPAPTDTDASSYPFVRVRAEPLINGEPVTRIFFDLGLILAMGATSLDEAYPFTCSCGVPGCDGIYEPGSIEVTEDLVAWVLPREPFARSIRHDLVPATGLVRLEFDRNTYEQVVEATIRQLENISRDLGAPLDIWPGSMGPECPNGQPRTLREELAAQRESNLDYEARMQWREETFGELLSRDLVLTMPNGFVYSIPYENLADAAVSDGYDWVENAQEKLDDEVAPRLHEGFESVVAVARAISWQQLVSWHLFKDEANPNNLTAEVYDAMTEWPDVTFSTRQESDRC